MSTYNQMKADAQHDATPYCYCPECGEQGVAVWEDCSFDHAFGTEHDGQWVSACCEAKVEEVW